MLRIGDFSSICQVSIKTLRYYDRLGLLKPAHVDPFTDHRYYSLAQMPRLNRILALKELGLSLEQIRQMLDDDLSPQQMRGMLQLKQAELEDEIEAARERLHRVEMRVRIMEEENQMPEYEVVLKTLESQRILSIRETLATAAEIEPLINEVMTALTLHNVAHGGPVMSMYHHEGFRDTDLDVEIAVAVADDHEANIALDEVRQLTVRQLNAQEEAATVIEDGHNKSWGGSYGAIGRWIEANNYEIVYPTREVYRTGPENDEGWVVEIQFPLRKKEPDHV